MAKKQEIAKIIEQKSLADGVFSMLLKTSIAKEAKAGQFVSLYCKDQTKLLPRPISICQIDREEGTLRLVYRVAGAGTTEFSGLQNGDEIRLLGPLGNGFPLEGKKPIIIGGGIGVPPMLGLTQSLANEAGLAKEDMTVVLGYRNNQLFLKDQFDACAKTYIATDDGSVGTHGTVVDVLSEKNISGDVIFACGPKPMLAAVKKWAAEQNIKCYVSMEERMACGIGACLACVCQTKEVDGHSKVHNARICKDGPVFLAEEVEL